MHFTGVSCNTVTSSPTTCVTTNPDPYLACVMIHIFCNKQVRALKQYTLVGNSVHLLSAI